MSIVFVNQTGVAGQSQTSPGPTIGYPGGSVAGNTLIAVGILYTNNTAITGISSITDSAGNSWNFSTSNSNNPPSAVDFASAQYCLAYVGWTINAASVTSVTIHDSTPNSDFWRVSILEYSGIVAADTGFAAAGTNANPGANLTLSNSGDLTVGSLDTINGTGVTNPAGWTGFTSSGNVPFVAAGFPGISGAYSPFWQFAGGAADYCLAVMAFSPVALGAQEPPVLYRMRVS